MAKVYDTVLDIMKILQVNLEKALNELPEDEAGDADKDNVLIANIAFAENGGTRFPNDTDGNNLVLTIIKIEEEFALKNQPAHRRNPVTGALEYVNPPAHLNLYVMLTSNNKSYEKSLLFLSRAIGYFQYKRVFTEIDSAIPPGLEQTRFKFNLNMFSPGFEQLNHIWGIFGGKHLPSVIYKLQLVDIQYVDEIEEGFEITEIVVEEKIF